MKLIGPFKQIVTMSNLPSKGSIDDDLLDVIENGGILLKGENIFEVGAFEELVDKYSDKNIELEAVEGDQVALPGFIDCHTHICWSGSRTTDYAKRLSGKTYLEIAQEGGGIWSSVLNTRKASEKELKEITEIRANQLLIDGITTVEVKSGYGLSVKDELKVLKAINKAQTKADLISTCLAAHIKPKDFEGTSKEYLDELTENLLPVLKEEDLTDRIDIFIEDSAFSVPEARTYLQKAKAMGFDVVIHGDQFSVGGSALAIELKAVSVDHLEMADNYEIEQLAKSNVVATVLPGASMGLGLPFAPARRLLDEGCSVAIASDWNPGSAPNGDLLMQATVLGAYEYLTIAETLAGITCRAADALNLSDRGVLKNGYIADIVAFKTNDFREVVYRQGKLKPFKVWKKGSLI